MVSRSKKNRYAEHHLVQRTNWLRAAVLGANDGILSTASIVSGMAAGGAEHATLLLAGLAALVAGAASMATGEYVSVSSQADMEATDIAREKHELAANPAHEQEELAQIYVGRGLDVATAREVARQLMVHDGIGAHVRDELGISEITTAKPMQAAFSSAASFALGAALPLLTAAFSPGGIVGWLVFVTSILSLTILGVVAARTGGVPPLRPTLRVVLWGMFSMGLTALIGALCGHRF